MELKLSLTLKSFTDFIMEDRISKLPTVNLCTIV